MKVRSFLNKIETLKKINEEFEQQYFLSSNSKENKSAESWQKNVLELERLKEKIEQEKLYLVVVGLFKRGKSSLVNAFIQKEILPYSVVPLTSVVTLLEYGDDDYAIIHFNDSSNKKIPFEEIPNYVTESNNPSNKKNVDYVNIYVNSDFLKRVTLVDTPGVGSTFENNTETTISFINRIDAALFTLSADFPISKTEVEFLKKMIKMVPKIIFVVNKTDLINKTELESIMSFNKKVLEDVSNSRDINIFPASARLALNGIENEDEELLDKSGLPKLQNEITELILSEKQNLLTESANNQFNILLNRFIAFLDIQLKILFTPLEQLNTSYEQYLRSIEIMNEDKNNFEILIKGKVKQLQEYFTEITNSFADKLTDELFISIDSQADKVKKEVRTSGIDILYEEYFKKIEFRYEPLKHKLEDEIISKFRNILVEYAKGSSKYLNELVKIFSNHSLFDFNELIESFDLKIYTSFYFLFDKNYLPGFLSNKFSRKIFMKLFKDRIFRKFKEALKQNIGKNAGRITYDINYRIQESFIKFNSNLNSKFEETVTLLNNIISDTIKKKQVTQDTVSGQIQYLSNKLETLNSLKSNEVFLKSK